MLPSRREGYGLVVIEAAARGTPVVVVAGPDNAAVELVAEGENGFVAGVGSPEEPGGGDPRACTSRAGAARVDRARGSTATRSALSLDELAGDHR